MKKFKGINPGLMIYSLKKILSRKRYLTNG